MRWEFCKMSKTQVFPQEPWVGGCTPGFNITLPLVLCVCGEICLVFKSRLWGRFPPRVRWVALSWRGAEMHYCSKSLFFFPPVNNAPHILIHYIFYNFNTAKCELMDDSSSIYSNCSTRKMRFITLNQDSTWEVVMGRLCRMSGWSCQISQSKAIKIKKDIMACFSNIQCTIMCLKRLTPMLWRCKWLWMLASTIFLA